MLSGRKLAEQGIPLAKLCLVYYKRHSFDSSMTAKVSLDLTNSPFMTLIHLVVAAISQVYMLLNNIHQPPKACAAASRTDPAALHLAGTDSA